MTIPEFVSLPPFNRNAVISFTLAVVTVLALCSGLLPVPFTVLLCYPPGAVLGLTSLFLGVKAQREVRADGKSGRILAIIAMWLSGLSIVAFACMTIAGIALVPRVTEYVKHILN